MNFGVKIPDDANGEVIGVSAMWQQVAGGPSSDATVEVTHTVPGDVVTSTNLVGLVAQNTPTGLTFTSPTILSPNDDLIISIGEIGGGDVNISVTVHVKFQHVA